MFRPGDEAGMNADKVNNILPMEKANRTRCSFAGEVILGKKLLLTGKNKFASTFYSVKILARK